MSALVRTREDVRPDVAEVMDEFVRRVNEVDGFPPIEKVLLYGSHARGDYNEDSDIDAAVILDAEEDFTGIRNLTRRLTSISVDMLYGDHPTAPSGTVLLSREVVDPEEGSFFANVLGESIEWKIPE